MAQEQKIRAFLALKTPPQWDAQLEDLQRELRRILEKAGKFRWVKPAQLHLTLRFFGYITTAEATKAGEIAARAAEDHSAFDLAATGLGCFPRPASPRVLWAGLREHKTLSNLHAVLSRETAHIGAKLEDRRFQPHLTLARIENFDRNAAATLADLIERHRQVISEPWPVTELLLMRSHLSPQGARYEVHSAHPLRSRLFQ